MGNLEELTSAAAAAASAYDEALAAGADEAALAPLRAEVDATERARSLAEWQEAQRAAFGDHLEFSGTTVTNIGVEPTVHDDEVS